MALASVNAMADVDSPSALDYILQSPALNMPPEYANGSTAQQYAAPQAPGSIMNTEPQTVSTPSEEPVTSTPTEQDMRPTALQYMVPQQGQPAPQQASAPPTAADNHAAFLKSAMKGPVPWVAGLAALAALATGHGRAVLPILGGAAQGLENREQTNIENQRQQDQLALQQQGQQFNQNLSAQDIALRTKSAAAEAAYRQQQAALDNAKAGMDAIRTISDQKPDYQQSWVESKSDDELKALGFPRSSFYDKQGNFIPLNSTDGRIIAQQAAFRKQFNDAMALRYDPNDPTQAKQKAFLESYDPGDLQYYGVQPSSYYTNGNFTGIPGMNQYQAGRVAALTTSANARAQAAANQQDKNLNDSIRLAQANVASPNFAQLPAAIQRPILDKLNADLVASGARSANDGPLPTVTPKMTIQDKLKAFGLGVSDLNDITGNDPKAYAADVANHQVQMAQQKIAVARTIAQIRESAKASPNGQVSPLKYATSIKGLYGSALTQYESATNALTDPFKRPKDPDALKTLTEAQSNAAARLALLQPELDKATNLAMHIQSAVQGVPKAPPLPADPNGNKVQPLPTPSPRGGIQSIIDKYK